MTRIFGTDGIRGRAGEGWLAPSRVEGLGRALGPVLADAGRLDGPRRALLGHDGRRSGPELLAALGRGLAAEGFETVSAGLITTPGLALLTRIGAFQLGAMISASHNPAADNGIKVFGGEGDKLSDALELAVEERLLAEAGQDGGPQDGPADVPAPPLDPELELRYLGYLLEHAAAGLKLDGLSLVLDCANGGGSRVAPRVFGRLGAQVTALCAEPDGDNINHGCGATQPALLQQEVRSRRADLGIALDGDGDRVIMVDGNGEIVDGDELLYIIAGSRLTNGGLNGSVVGTLMSNLGLEVALRDLGVGFERVAVGDRYILERLSERDWTLGGEPSGHIICRDRTTTGDGIVSALQVLAEINKTGRSLAELRRGMRKYPQELVNVPLGDIPAADVMADSMVNDAVSAVESDMGDDGRVLLRPSGTEPLIRVMVEGREADVVASKANAIADAVRELVSR